MFNEIMRPSMHQQGTTPGSCCQQKTPLATEFRKTAQYTNVVWKRLISTLKLI